MRALFFLPRAARAGPAAHWLVRRRRYLPIENNTALLMAYTAPSAPMAVGV